MGGSTRIVERLRLRHSEPAAGPCRCRGCSSHGDAPRRGDAPLRPGDCIRRLPHRASAAFALLPSVSPRGMEDVHGRRSRTTRTRSGSTRAQASSCRARRRGAIREAWFWPLAAPALAPPASRARLRSIACRPGAPAALAWTASLVRAGCAAQLIAARAPAMNGAQTRRGWTARPDRSIRPTARAHARSHAATMEPARPRTARPAPRRHDLPPR